jgi:hypothetical protein
LDARGDGVGGGRGENLHLFNVDVDGAVIHLIVIRA